MMKRLRHGLSMRISCDSALRSQLKQENVCAFQRILMSGQICRLFTMFYAFEPGDLADFSDCEDRYLIGSAVVGVMGRA